MFFPVWVLKRKQIKASFLWLYENNKIIYLQLSKPVKACQLWKYCYSYYNGDTWMTWTSCSFARSCLGQITICIKINQFLTKFLNSRKISRKWKLTKICIFNWCFDLPRYEYIYILLQEFLCSIAWQDT